MNDETLNRVRSQMSGGFCGYCGISVDEIGEDYCIMSVPLEEHHLNPHGIVHGGMIFTMADTAAGALARSLGREDAGVTQDASIYYLRPAVGSVLRARAQMLKCGRYTALIQVDVTDETNRSVARAEVTIFFRDHLA